MSLGSATVHDLNPVVSSSHLLKYVQKTVMSKPKMVCDSLTCFTGTRIRMAQYIM